MLGVHTQDQTTLSQIICFLLEAGARIDIQNMDNKTAIDLADDPMVKQFMKM